jgi:hypothetical protein
MKKSRTKNKIVKNQAVKNILLALVVIVFGFILFNVTFVFDAIYQGILMWFVGLFINIGPDMTLYWLPPLFHSSFVVVIGIISWFIFNSRLKTIYKAIYMTVPLAVVFVTLGIFLSQWLVLSYIAGVIFGICVLYYLYRTQQPWIYYFSLIFVSIVMLIVAIFGIEI